MTMIGISIVFLMMIMRIRALYARIFSVQAVVFAIFITFVGVNAYVLTHGIPVKDPANNSVSACTGIIDPKIGRTFTSSTAWLPLVFDTTVMFLTMYRTARSAYSRTTSDTFRVLFREGLLYYSIICTVTLVLTIMINTAAPSIRNVGSQYACFHRHLLVRSASNCRTLGLRRCALRLHLCLTVALMSRITLHLRRFANSPNNVIIYYDHTARQPHPRPPHPHQTFLSTASQPVITSFAPPSPPPPPQQTLPSIYPPQQYEMGFLPPPPRNNVRAAAASSLSSLESGSYFGMDTFSTVTGAAVPAEAFRM
ncbi:hypothetical protein F5888DRAFT_1910259 [Russula emetica]|nr:hypothetical protein F5888DRAFT_1910259 [Russula emetica]